MSPLFEVGGGLLALGIARAMRRTGVPVVVFTTTEESLLPYSRRCRFVSVAPGDDGALLRAVLAEAVNWPSPPVLIPAGDKALLFLCTYADQLGERVRMVVPSLDAANGARERSLRHVRAAAWRTGATYGGEWEIALEFPHDRAGWSQFTAPDVSRCTRRLSFTRHCQTVRPTVDHAVTRSLGHARLSECR